MAWPHPSDVSAKFTKSMLFLFQYDAVGVVGPDGRRAGGLRRVVDGGAMIAMSSGAVIARARNRIVREFLSTDADWLLQVDTDMVFDPDLVDRLVAAADPIERPVVGALCFAVMHEQSRRFWPTLFAYIPGSTRLRRLTQYPPDTLIPVAATGAACLLVHRSVLVAMQARYSEPRPWFDETSFFELDADGVPIAGSGDEYSEDITFCLRAQACGFPVMVHTGIQVGHVKEFVATEAEYAAESAMLAESAVPALPTYAVVASKDRPGMLATLVAQLSGQVAKVFVMDNGYDDPEVLLGLGAATQVVHCHDLTLHKMWNCGLTMAAEAAAGSPHNVLIVNDDVEVETAVCAKLEAALRAHDDHWAAYPNHHGAAVPPGGFVRTQSDKMAGQTIAGWCVMLRGEDGLRFDERFAWWYGDTDLERRIRHCGRFVVAVDAGARHLDPLRSTLEDPARLAQAEADEALFAAKWDVDPGSLWLAQWKPAA